MASIIWFKLVVILGELGVHGLPPGGGVRVGTLLQHSSDGNLSVQAFLAALHEHSYIQMHFMPGWLVQHWRIVRGKCPVPGGAYFLGALSKTAFYHGIF